VVKYAFGDVTDIGSSLQMRTWPLLVKTRVARVAENYPVLGLK